MKKSQDQKNREELEMRREGWSDRQGYRAKIKETTRKERK